MTPRTRQRVCPICLGVRQELLAMSRYDNKTRICPDCGTIEACNTQLIQMAQAGGMGFPSYARRMADLGYKNEAAKEIVKLIRRHRGKR